MPHVRVVRHKLSGVSAPQSLHRAKLFVFFVWCSCITYSGVHASCKSGVAQSLGCEHTSATVLCTVSLFFWSREQVVLTQACMPHLHRGLLHIEYNV